MSSASLVLFLLGVLVVLAVLVEDEIGRVKEGTLFGADVDERRLNARKNCFDFTEVDVADHPPGFGAVDEELDELVVLDDRDPRFARVRIDENFSLHVDRPSA